MITFSKVLVPVDFSAVSAGALRYALAMTQGETALAKDARVTVAHAIDVDGLHVAQGAEPALRDLTRWRETLRAFVREVVPGPAGDAIDVEVVGAGPRAAVPELAAKYDLVVMGCRSRLTGADLTPGGVAEATMRASPVPVIAVKHRFGGGKGAAEPGWPPPQIVFATDLTQFSRAPFRYAMAAAFACDAPITTLHVVQDARELRESERLPISLAQEIDAFYETELAWRRDELGRFVRDRMGAPRPIDVREAVRKGDPAVEIAAECRERGAGLLVLATHGGGGLKKMLLGSVAEKAVRLAPCTVMTVRPPA